MLMSDFDFDFEFVDEDEEVDGQWMKYHMTHKFQIFQCNEVMMEDLWILFEFGCDLLKRKRKDERCLLREMKIGNKLWSIDDHDLKFQNTIDMLWKTKYHMMKY